MKLFLTEHEKLSSTWRKIRESLQDELDICRLKNDNDMPPEQTAKLRGHIERLKLIIKAGEGEPAPDNSPESSKSISALLGDNSND